MMKRITYMLLFIGLSFPAWGQCNYKLVEIAAAKSGENTVFIRDFKVKLSPGTMSNPSPVGRFPVFLNKGVHYRFTIANAEEKEGRGILQLMRRDQILGSTYDTENQLDRQKFDFICEKSATYQVLISFIHSREGCAAGVLSMVVNDSVKTMDIQFQEQTPPLYLFIPNKLDITATDIPEGSIKVEISQGKIVEQNGDYIAYPLKEGTAKVYVTSYKKTGEVNEIDSIVFDVEPPPLPDLVLPGQYGRTISKMRFINGGEVGLFYPFETNSSPYTLIEYTLSSSRFGLEGYSSSDKITFQQIRLVNDLQPGDKLYIKNIKFKDPNGKVYTINTLEILIME